MQYSIKGNLVDLVERKIYAAEIFVKDKKIEKIIPLNQKLENYILPGFVDAHVHIESAMMPPSEFARMAVVHGSVATISDPHEIANVLGYEGVKYMIDSGKQTPFKFCFGLPSCVPATGFETAGAVIDAKQTEEYIQNPDLYYLAEMMNFPAVIHDDAEVMAKLAAAQKAGKVIDGHAPQLRGENMRKYFSAGITTDHECITYEEAKEKLEFGVKVLIREGSAAKNFDALIPLLKEFPAQIMFCSDDKHPDSLSDGHINLIVKRALGLGYELFDVLRASSLNVVGHYNIPVGLCRVNDPADFIVVNDLSDFHVLQTYINGSLVADNGKTLIPRTTISAPNNFNCRTKKESDFNIKLKSNSVKVIEALNGQLITNRLQEIVDLELQNNLDKDILKITVVNRYDDAAPAVAFVKNFGLQNAAIASSVAHDSHNIISTGSSDALICKAVNLLVKCKGGLSFVSETESFVIPLPIAGLMSLKDGYELSADYIKIDALAKMHGSKLTAPFMSLSFMALLVIPHLKLSDKGLFDCEKFGFTEV